MFEVQTSEQPRASILTLQRNDQQNTLAFDKEVLQHPGVGSPLQNLFASVSAMATELAANAPDLSSEGLAKRAKAYRDRNVAGPFRLAQEAQVAATRTIERERNRLHTPRFPDGSEPAVRSEQRTYARSLPLNRKIEAAKTDPSLAAAMVEGGPTLSDVAPDIFARLERDMAEGQLAEELMRVHPEHYSTVPNADQPIGGAPNLAAAQKVAKERLDAIDAERELLGRVPGLLADVVTAVSLMTDETRQVAFERLTA